MPEGKSYSSQDLAELLTHLQGKNQGQTVSYSPEEVESLIVNMKAKKAERYPEPPPLGPGESVYADAIPSMPANTRVVHTPTQIWEPRPAGGQEYGLEFGQGEVVNRGSAPPMYDQPDGSTSVEQPGPSFELGQGEMVNRGTAPPMYGQPDGSTSVNRPQQSPERKSSTLEWLMSRGK